MLRLTDVGTGDTETILGVGGQVNFNDDLGDWGLNISVGLSKNVSGTATDPELRLTSFSLQSEDNPSTLIIELSDTDFVGTGPIPFLGSVNGASVVELEYQAYASLTNTHFIQGPMIGDTGLIVDNNTHAFSNTLNLAGPYSLTMVFTVDHTDFNQITQFDALL